MTAPISRRTALQRTTALAAGLGISPALAEALASPGKREFMIGACDWSIGCMASLKAFDVAREIGLDGIQASLGTEQDDMQLRKPEVQQSYLDASKRTGVAIASLAIGTLNKIPYKSDPRTIPWVSGSVDACKALGREVVLLAFFGNGDLKGDKKGTEEVIRRLKDVAPRAEEAGVTLGIESWLSGEEHMHIIDRVGSPAVKVYYDVANSNKMGYDIYSEIRWLGKKNQICEIHMKENGALLGEGKVDFKKVRAAVEDCGYTGWMQIEGAVPKGARMLPSYVSNLKLLRSLFA
jgi:sugar phosphate isomerase/epimerase